VENQIFQARQGLGKGGGGGRTKDGKSVDMIYQ